ncbi:lytic murein transglycosylase [Mesorhizobium sp. WSM3876]|nr:lytic murein transglycosylase [Mesorhizobium sp. WSM3876]
MAFRHTPLCPAGHLPRMGGDWQFHRPGSSCNVGDWRKRTRHPISPLAGEISGRTEGGTWAQPCQSVRPA